MIHLWRKYYGNFWKFYMSSPLCQYINYALPSLLMLFDMITDLNITIKVYNVNSFLFMYNVFTLLAPIMVYWSSDYNFYYYTNLLSRREYRKFTYCTSISSLINAIPVFGLLMVLVKELQRMNDAIILQFIHLFKVYYSYYMHNEMLALQNYTKKLSQDSRNKDIIQYKNMMELMYETLPQIVPQVLMFYWGFANNKLTNFELLLSIGASFTNLIFNIIKMLYASRDYGVSLIEYIVFFMAGKKNDLKLLGFGLKNIDSISNSDYYFTRRNLDNNWIKLIVNKFKACKQPLQLDHDEYLYKFHINLNFVDNIDIQQMFVFIFTMRRFNVQLIYPFTKLIYVAKSHNLLHSLQNLVLYDADQWKDLEYNKFTYSNTDRIQALYRILFKAYSFYKINTLLRLIHYKKINISVLNTKTIIVFWKNTEWQAVIEDIIKSKYVSLEKIKSVTNPYMVLAVCLYHAPFNSIEHLIDNHLQINNFNTEILELCKNAFADILSTYSTDYNRLIKIEKNFFNEHATTQV